MSVSAYLHLDAPVSSTLLTHYCQQPSHKDTFEHFWRWKLMNPRIALVWEHLNIQLQSFFFSKKNIHAPVSSLGQKQGWICIMLPFFGNCIMWYHMICNVWWNWHFDLSPWGSSLNEWVVSYGCPAFFSVRMFSMIFYSELATLSLNFTLTCLCILIG